MPVFNDFDFETALAPQCGAKFCGALTSKSAPVMAVFNEFDFETALAPRGGANFAELNFKKAPGMGMPVFNDFGLSQSFKGSGSTWNMMESVPQGIAFLASDVKAAQECKVNHDQERGVSIEHGDRSMSNIM